MGRNYLNDKPVPWSRTSIMFTEALDCSHTPQVYYPRSNQYVFKNIDPFTPDQNPGLASYVTQNRIQNPMAG